VHIPCAIQALADGICTLGGLFHNKLNKFEETKGDGERELGVRFVIIIENKAKRSQEEIDKEFGVIEYEIEGNPYRCSRWKCFEWEGKKYCTWITSPHFFSPEEDPKMWEALRKYLVKVRNFLGGGKVYLGNDIVYVSSPEDTFPGEGFFLPPPLDEECLKEPRDPKLKEVKELEGLIW